MLEARATVVRLEGSDAIVEAEQGGGGGCGSCGSNGCGSGKLSQMLCVRPRQFRARNAIDARVGDHVQVAVADGQLLRGALTLYGMPLVLLLVGALSGAHWSGQPDAGAAIGAVAGLMAGFVVAWFIAVRQRGSSPTIIHCERTTKSAIL